MATFHGFTKYKSPNVSAIPQAETYHCDTCHGQRKMVEVKGQLFCQTCRHPWKAPQNRAGRRLTSKKRGSTK